MLLGAHLAILWRQKHTQFPGPGRTERNVVGSHLWPTYTARSMALFCLLLAALAALAGLAQINPVWLYGPFRPYSVSTAAQPDWYLGWIEGALRVFPAWEPRIFGKTIANPFFPSVLMPGITFVLLYMWPFIEARVTRDRDDHHLLDRPRYRPVRTAIGTSVLTFYFVLTLAGAQDVFSQQMDLSITAVVRGLQILLVVLPVGVGLLTYKVCKDLAGGEHLLGEQEEARAPFRAIGKIEPANGNGHKDPEKTAAH